jgi:L-asparagine oxygenase
MVAYEAEGHGRLYQDMVPNRAMALSQTSLGSGVELELHTEQAFSKLRPDILSLACLRGHPDAKTYVLPAHVLLEHMTPFERKLLRRELWTTGVDGSFKLGGHEFIEGDLRGPLAIIGGAQDDPTIVFDQDLMVGVTDEAQALIARVVEVYRAHRFSVTLAPGQILLVDNVRAVHGRSPFTPSFDGADRFISRSFAVRDLVRTRYARPGNSRTVAAEYS